MGRDFVFSVGNVGFGLLRRFGYMVLDFWGDVLFELIDIGFFIWFKVIMG